MADLTNRSRFRVTVKNRDDLTQHFSFNNLDEVEAYMAQLRVQHLKPRVEQLDESWLVRIREKGHKLVTATFKTRKEAEGFIARTAEERSRGLFVDYTASLKVSLAQLIVRYLLEESPKHKSHQVLAYSRLLALMDEVGRDIEAYKDGAKVGKTFDKVRAMLTKEAERDWKLGWFAFSRMVERATGTPFARSKDWRRDPENSQLAATHGYTSPSTAP